MTRLRVKLLENRMVVEFAVPCHADNEINTGVTGG
jgi:hypothetical protein